MSQNVRPAKLKYTQKCILPPSGRRKTTPSPQDLHIKASAPHRENCVLVIGVEADYLVKIKQARHLLRQCLAIKLSSEPFVICEVSPSRPCKDDLIIEKVFSCLVSRKMREHREELIHQVSKARTGKPRKAYVEKFIDPGSYVPIPFGFGSDCYD